MTYEYEIERKTQINYGREKLDSGTVLKMKPAEVKKPRNNAPRTGHDGYLAVVSSERRYVTIVLLTGEEIKGDLYGFDKFALLLKRHDNGVEQWFYKSALQGFIAQPRG